MNSEELEQSLRTEFEAHLKMVFADVQQEINGLQEQVEQEFARHRAQLTEAFENFSARRASAASGNELDAGFRESIVEHLRLARDEGARITATAIAEAEDMERASADAAVAVIVAAPAVAGISELTDGINDVCSQSSQAAILKSLVAHAGQFTPRGAFFIVKNEHLVGWRVFGRDEQGESETVREIFFPVADQTTLGESLKSLRAVESSFGANAGDSAFLDKLGFGEPEKMVAVPLVARGRGVAVLYADKGENGADINVEALETLVRVAGLTVEVLAAQAAATSATRQSSAATYAPPAAADNYAHETAPTEIYEARAEQSDFDADADYQTSETKQTVEADAPVAYDSYAETTNEPVSYETESSADDFSSQSDFQAETTEFDTASFDTASNQYSSSEYTTSGSLIEESVDVSETASETAVQAEEFGLVYEAEQTESHSRNQPAEKTFAEERSAEFSESGDERHGAAESYSDDADEAAITTDASYQFEDARPVESTENQSAPESPVESYQQFESSEFDAAASSLERTPQSAEDFAPVAAEVNYDSFKPESSENRASQSEIGGFVDSLLTEKAAEAPVETAKPTRSRFSDKNIDLPVEVSEDERRLHNDARRFARLLVSEIKLYNEQKVKEGRDENDLYERLREAIDRSREMYDKRVQPPVAAKFDYFHYELVNSLAEGSEAKLGERYVGAAV